jgi:hypothetical protein
VIELASVKIPIERCPSCRGVRFQLHALLSEAPEERDVRGFEITELRYSERENPDTHTMELCVHMTTRDRSTGVRGPLASIESVSLDYWEQMSLGARAAEARRAVLNALQHELDECFYVRGVRVYDPHKEDR